MDGREVFLCWRLGEPEVSYWHDLDAGFAGRQPLPAHAGSSTVRTGIERRAPVRGSLRGQVSSLVAPRRRARPRLIGIASAQPLENSGRLGHCVDHS